MSLRYHTILLVFTTIIENSNQFRVYSTCWLILLCHWLLVIFHLFLFQIWLFDCTSIGHCTWLNIVDPLSAMRRNLNIKHFISHLIKILSVIEFGIIWWLIISCGIAFTETSFLMNHKVAVLLTRHNRRVKWTAHLHVDRSTCRNYRVRQLQLSHSFAKTFLKLYFFIFFPKLLLLILCSLRERWTRSVRIFLGRTILRPLL